MTTKEAPNSVKQELKALQTWMNRRFDQQIYWIVGSGIATAAIIIAPVKL